MNGNHDIFGTLNLLSWKQDKPMNVKETDRSGYEPNGSFVKNDKLKSDWGGKM